MPKKPALLEINSDWIVYFGLIICFSVVNRIASAVHREHLENGEQRRAALVKKSEIRD